MKNIIIKFTVIASVVLSIVSCEEELDINQDENLPTNVDARFYLTAAEASLATNLGGILTNYGGFMAQYHTQAPGASQYLEIDEYNVTTVYANRMWREAYAGGINDLDKVIELSVGNTGDLLIAKCIRAYYFQVLTDFFGKIPYSEVLTGVNDLNPAPVPQQNIYASLINSVSNALDDYTANPIRSTFGSQDIFLNSKMSSWESFANTLLLKMYMRLWKTEDANPTAINDLLAKNNFLSEDVAFNIYVDEVNKKNPFNGVQLDQLGDLNLIASNSLLMFLELNNDPRIETIYRLDNEGNFDGIDQGDRSSVISQQARNFSRPNVSAIQPVYLFTAAESNFLQAEALVRYASGAGAQAKYEAGVRASFVARGVTGEEALIAGNYAYGTSSKQEEQIRQIIIQKWVANAYYNSIESYFDQLRTGFPEIVADSPDYANGNLLVSINSIQRGGITPLSMFYSLEEVNRNRNLQQKPNLFVPVWWNE